MNNGVRPKSIGRKIARSVARNELLWSLLGKPVSRLGESFSYWRHYELRARDAFEVLGTLTVLNGPFRGLVYPELTAAGSALSAKLIGSYECELHPFIERMRGIAYSDVIDVGCAEGYYAVGFALMFPEAEVYAFDIDPEARELCQKMARANQVQSRVHVRGECTGEYLGGLQVKRGLVVSDCEGWEKMLFDEAVARQLGHCDIIIEAHDLIDPTISSTLLRVFANTHRVTAVKALPDEVKADLDGYPQMKGLTKDARLRLMGEGRHAPMEWLICASLSAEPVL